MDSIGITVSDLDRAVEFYRDVLTFEKVSERESAGTEHERLAGVFGLNARTARLRLGSEIIELTEYRTPAGRPIPPDSRSNDRWFQHIAIITNDMNRAYDWLRTRKVRQISPSPQTLPAWNRQASGIRAFYFRDPDGHALEVLSFPPGKGNPRWHEPSGNLFLGIDHTAIAAGDTDASLRFYRDELGLAISGESENYGIEQERLNNVFGARLRITSLRGTNGPGVELLEYLTPRDGRPMPKDSRSTDLWHWQTNLTVPDIKDAARRLNSIRADFVSPGVVTLPDASAGFTNSFAVRDPDGHAIQVRER